MGGHDECDYFTVSCAVDGHVDNHCKVKRKGSSTWRDLGDKPSLKIKLDDKYTVGSYDCSNELCPPDQQPNETVNTWRTKKFTLNNQVTWDAEIDAYAVYRTQIPASLAVQVAVALYKDGVLQSNQTYAMIENVNDDAFIEKWYGGLANWSRRGPRESTVCRYRVEARGWPR